VAWRKVWQPTARFMVNITCGLTACYCLEIRVDSRPLRSTYLCPTFLSNTSNRQTNRPRQRQS